MGNPITLFIDNLEMSGSMSLVFSLCYVSEACGVSTYHYYTLIVIYAKSNRMATFDFELR